MQQLQLQNQLLRQQQQKLETRLQQHQQPDNSNSTASNDNRKRDAPDGSIEQSPSSKEHRLFGLWANIFNQNSSSIRHMPIDIDNGLPGIVLDFGCVTFLCHVDSCAAMSTGNSLVHSWIMSTYPEIVVDYGEYNDPDPFVPLDLRCAVASNAQEPTESKKDLRNSLTKYVTYKTSYIVDGKPATVTFGLGDNISVKTIVGLPFMKSWEMDLLISQNVVRSNKLGLDFPIEYAATSASLPKGIVFTAEQFVRPQPGIASTASVNSTETMGITDGCFDGMEASMYPVSNAYTIVETCDNGILKRSATLIEKPNSEL
jgi:hypothetical protein